MATFTNEFTTNSAVLDSAHVGDIRGALGTIRLDDMAPRRGISARMRTMLAILGPGLIVMVGDNDAGAFGTYTQAGQNYGTRLLWTLLLLIPVLYVNQEMVLRLGAVTGVGHARLILERYGRFWGAFSVIDLFLLNAMTIVTEFIGISLGLRYLGVPLLPGVAVSAVIILAAVSTGSFRRFERISLALVAGSLLLVPVFVMAHPALPSLAHDLLVPGMPSGSSLSDVMLLIIAIVGTTVAPWQLFFQQSYVIDKRITPRFMAYEKIDLWIGISLAVMGAGAMMAFTTFAVQGTGRAGNFTDALGVAQALGATVSHSAGVLFAIALIDASIIGASAVGLSTSYAIGDVLGLRHSLHRKASDAKGFYAVFAALIIGAATIVVIPGSPLGLLTEGVQTLAGVLLPSATVFLLLLCNDRAVLGPWVNTHRMNVFTGLVTAVLVMLSVILTAAVLFPGMGSGQMLDVLASGAAISLVGWAVVELRRRRNPVAPVERAGRDAWRMPKLEELVPDRFTGGRRLGLAVLRGYLLIAMALVVVRIIQLALAH
ncbi:MAG: NRAMP family divalent metal transporter [Candidatus Nanopelagicales bacterium]